MEKKVRTNDNKENRYREFESIISLKLDRIGTDISGIKKTIESLPCLPHGEKLVRHGEQIKSIGGQIRGLWTILFTALGAVLGLLIKFIGGK